MTNYEKIVDPNNCDNIVITNSKGDVFEFEQVALITLHEVGYAILKPLNPALFNLENDEPLIFKLNDEEQTIVWFEKGIVNIDQSMKECEYHEAIISFLDKKKTGLISSLELDCVILFFMLDP